MDFIPKSSEGYFFFDLLNKQVNRRILQRGLEYEGLAYITQVSREERVIRVIIIQGVLQVRCVLSDNVLYSINVNEIVSINKLASNSRGPGWAKLRIATEKSNSIPTIKMGYKNALVLEKTCKKLKFVPIETLQIQKASQRSQFKNTNQGVDNDELVSLATPVHLLISVGSNSEVEVKLDLRKGMVYVRTAEGITQAWDYLSIYQYCYNETNQSILLTGRKGKLLAMHRLVGGKEKVLAFDQSFQMFLEYNYRLNCRPNPFLKMPLCLPVQFNADLNCFLELDLLSHTFALRNRDVPPAYRQDTNLTYFYDIDSISKISVTPTKGMDLTLAFQNSNSEQLSIKFKNKKCWNFFYNFAYSKKVISA